ncbi:MAG: hypothetical protein IKN72_07680 [Clostridia bacterium]|nr:hypothetical protein [Clostridia bacterium]
MKKLISILLVMILCAASFTFHSHAEKVYKDETTRETVSAFFEDLFGRAADTFDKIGFFFASFRHDEGIAAVKTGATALVAKGFESRDGDIFKISSGFSAKVYCGNRPFHRVTLRYASTQPLKLTVTGKEGKNDVANTFFLEAAQDGVFSGIIESYLYGGTAKKLISLDIETCSGKTAEVSLKELKTERLKPLAEHTVYLENDRFKLGIQMLWGGTISYLEDKRGQVDGLTNLVNKHDTGRLIQQSYYGTGYIEGVYDPGTSFGTAWKYNPVQGGDQFGNGGRLIDYRLSENALYIKSQPCDWAQNAVRLPFYTENTYTLEVDHIRVDNRAVDFSGYTHTYESQELPAVYLVSYLDAFTCYNGEQPWTGDELTVYPNLDFWGPRGTQIAYFKACNTETWCAWYSSDDDFGFGLYVPNVDSLGGGRYEEEVRSKSDTDSSTSQVSPGNIFRMTAYAPFEFSYLMATGSVEEIRGIFTENKDFAENADLHKDSVSFRLPSEQSEVTRLDFTNDMNRAMYMPVNCAVSHDAAENALKISSNSGGDVMLTVNYLVTGFHLRAEDYPTLKIEYMIPTSNSAESYNSEIYPCAGETLNPTAEAMIWVDGLAADGQYHTLVVDLSASPYWQGEIHRLRFDYFNASAPGDVMYIKSITLA